jgi:nucleotide-binding universal stress UspA family protein
MSTPTKHRGILVGVDGSPASKVAADWAARDAALRKVPLTLVHVLSPPVVMSWPETPTPPGFRAGRNRTVTASFATHSRS